MSDEVPSNRRRILFVAHTPGFYGAERSLLDVVVGLKARGWAPLLIVPKKGNFTAALEGEGIPFVIRLHKAWIGDQPRLLRIPYRLLVNARAWWVLSRQLAGVCDLVYSNTVAKPLGMLLAATWNVPHVLHVREFVEADMGQNYDFGRDMSLDLIGRRSQRVICNSRAVFEMLTPHIPAPKMRVVYNGMLKATAPSVAPRRQGLAGKRPLALCMVGHLTAHKGHRDAIGALARLRQDGIDALIEVAGDGPEGYRHELERLAVDLGVGAQVRFLGYCNDVAEVFARADIHLVCSRCEAFGRVAVESMALGVPVVGADSGGLPEIVRDGRNGLLYKPGDVAALAAQIRRLIDEPGLYETFSRQGQQDVYADFGRERCIDAIEVILDEALAIQRRAQ